MPSKITVHLSGYVGKTFDILARMQPSVVKVFNQSSEMNIDAIRQICPRTIIVYRQFTTLDYHNSSADTFFAELSDTFHKLRGRGILWEGLNEPVVQSIEDAKLLNAWYVRYTQLMHAQGELVAGFSWSTGNPVSDKLGLVVPYLTEAAAAVDVHAFHEYYSLWGGQWDWARYRDFEAELPAYARKPVVITEAGLDDNGDPYTGGYRPKKSYQEYLEILKAYDAVLMEDPYVLGATVFAWGDWGWPSFEIDPMIDMIANYVASTGGGVVFTKPYPKPNPEPQPAFTLGVNPTSIFVGQSATLQWDADGVREAYLDDGAVAGHGTKVVSPTQTTTYTLRLVLRDNSVKNLAATLTVKPVPVATFAFSATPETIVAGKSAMLNWDVENVQAVYLNGVSVAGHETRVVTPAQTATYILRVMMLDGTTKDLTAKVSVVPQPAYSFNITPTSITAGQSATLAWQTAGTRTITLQDQPIQESGSTVVTPLRNTTYVLTMSFWDGTTKDLNATINVVPPPPATYSFSASPMSITGDQTSTVQWDVSRATLITLNGQNVGLHGSQVVKPVQTTTYALHIVFDDGTTRDLTTTVNVTSQPPMVTRAPTVVITLENLARLRTYPRPEQDNGRGLHFGMDLRDESIRVTVNLLLSINARWTMIYAPDENQAKRAAQACWNAGIMPIVRIARKVDETFDPVIYTDAVKATGAPAYIQLYNEPGDLREWNNYPGASQWVSVFASRWARAAAQVMDAGGYPGLQILSREEFDAVVNAVQGNGRTDIWQRAFFALHNYGANHPPAYPYDARNQQDHPGATILSDDTSVLNFLEFAKWMQDRIGFVLPIIGGEGGWQFNAHEDARYPAANRPYHAQYHSELFNWFRTGVLSNGEALPDYLFSVAPWIASGWGADDWWGGPLGDKIDTIQAVQAIPAFVRKFAWDGSVVLPPPTFTFSATPTTIQPGGSATLQWNTTGVRIVSLDGVAVANNGSKVVAPAQTTTYVLHIDFFDATSKDLSATVTVSTPTPPTPGIDWDARLEAIGVKSSSANASQAWRITSARYLDQNESAGKQHVVLKVLGANGDPVPGIRLVIDWNGRSFWDQPAVVSTDAKGEANCPLWSAYNPAKSAGPYFVYVNGAESDRITGLGLPNGRKVSFQLTYQWSTGTTPPPPPPPPTPTASLSASPSIVAIGTSSTLLWDATGARAVTVNGQAVASKGTLVVTPATTTSYTCHIIYPDNSIKDLVATIAVTGFPPPSGVQWDERLTPLGIKHTPVNSAQGWRLIAAKYQDETESGGNHHVYYKLFNANGTPAAGVKIVVDWLGRESGDQPAVITTGANGEANCALWSILHPDLRDGPYLTFIKGVPSDQVSGMGLPMNRHVNFVLTFKFQ